MPWKITGDANAAKMFLTIMSSAGIARVFALDIRPQPSKFQTMIAR
jgi:hypothetical protein